jgi:hypothetical protein
LENVPAVAPLLVPVPPERPVSSPATDNKLVEVAREGLFSSVLA